MKLTSLNSDFNSGEPVVIAGPCSIESLEQSMATAVALKKIGVGIFRGGAWKPRTMPGCFEGLGREALDILAEVKRATGMLTAVEVATAAHVTMAVEAGVVILWIGARTTGNPFAVQEVANAMKDVSFRGTVLVKNHATLDLDLWIGAIMRLQAAGLTRLVAVHRGFPSYSKSIYRNMPRWEMAFELRRRMPSIKILLDPSHIGGRRDLILPLSQQALDMRFDGLMIESHCCPDCALSDAAQQVTPEELKKILVSLSLGRDAFDADMLSSLREDIDRLDDRLLEVLSERMELCRRIGSLKREEGLSVVQNDRYSELLSSRMAEASQLGLSPEFVRRVLADIHAESVRQQVEIVGRRKASDDDD